ncbi:MAG: GNAT family N-acetyltransferase [Anaerolineales bacterium]
MNGPNQEIQFEIRKATQEDSGNIRKMILSTGINPTGLNWERFLVAVSKDGTFIGCGQVKPHVDGTMELASIAVRRDWRGRGVARALIEALIASHSGELYLMCTSNLGPLYEKFGFREIPEGEMPTYFRRVSKLGGVLSNIAIGQRLLVMRRMKR